MDEHCTTTLSVQLDGEKRWRLGWMPPPKEGVRSKQSIYSDGAVYSMNKGKENLLGPRRVFNAGFTILSSVGSFVRIDPKERRRAGVPSWFRS